MISTVFNDNAHRVLIEHQGEEITYGQAWARARSLARTWGLSHGDRVAFTHPNHPSHVIGILACVIGGYTYCPVGDREKLDILRPALVIEKPVGTEWAPLVDIQHPPDNDRFATVFTSGTEGKPKGICFSLSRAMALADAFGKLCGFNDRTAMYHVLPMYHNAGFVNTILAPMMRGGRIVVGKRFSPVYAMNFPWFGNALTLTPTMAIALARYAKNRDELKGKLTHRVFSTAGQLTEFAKRRFEESFGIELHDVYGMTELGGPLTLDGKIVDGAEVENDGQIRIRSQYQMTGWLDADGFHETPVDFLPTGDIGELYGGLRITGRKKDVIIRGGENICPARAEDLARGVAGVADAAVVGVSDEAWGEVAFCFIEPMPGANPLDDVRQACLALQGGQRPERYLSLSEFPRAGGKVNKAALRALAAALE